MASLHAQAIAEVDGLVVDYCVSRDRTRALDFAARHGLGGGRALDDLGADAQVDALWVVAPADVMATAATQLARFGLPMFLEKPVGLSLAETRAARQAIAVPTMVGLNRRFYEVIARGQALVQAAGGVRAIEVHMPEDLTGGASVNAPAIKAGWPFANSVHLIDLFRAFAGEPASVASANAAASVEDRSYASLLRFEDGATGLYNAQWYAPGGWRVAVYAEGLALIYQPIEQLTVIRRPRVTEVIAPTGPDARLKPGLFGQAEAFRDLIRTGRRHPMVADLADYERSVALVDTLTRVGSQGIG